MTENASISDTKSNVGLYSQREIKHILVPIDLLNESSYGLRYAIALARCYDAELFLFYCTSESLPDGGMRVREHLRELMTQSDNSLYPPIIWQVIITEGQPELEIPRVAAQCQIDLIVMLARRRPIAAALFGSTTENICRFAPCPVLIIHQGERTNIDETMGKLSFKRILIGYDYSHYADLALACGLSLTREYGSELHILRVLPIKSGHQWKPASLEELHSETDKLLAQLPEDARTDINIKPVIAEGQPYDEILNYSQRYDIDLICLGTHGQTAKHLLGTTLDRVVRTANCPVLVASPLAWDLDMTEETHNKRVLIAYDGSPFSNIALREAAERNWPTGTELRVISVMEPLATLGPAETHYHLPCEVVNALEKLVVKASDMLMGEGRIVSHVVRSGFAAEAIIAEAYHWHADLILIGTHSRRGLSHLLLGSVAERVAGKSPCSVEIVRQHDYANTNWSGAL